MTHKIDWRTLVPSLDEVYMFQGALYCKDCGQSIQKEIQEEGKAPMDEKDEESFDSDDFPKGPFEDGGGEADGPHHCDNLARCLNAIELPCGSKIGAWLGNDLTNEGARWLSDSIKSSLFRDDEFVRQINRLWRLKYEDSVSPLNSVTQVTDSLLTKLPTKTFIASINKLQSQIINQVWYDLDSFYGFSMQKEMPNWKQPAALSVWKSELLPEGRFGHPKKVELPASAASEREAQDILQELIEEYAWD